MTNTEINADTPRAVPLLLRLLFWWVKCGAFTTEKKNLRTSPRLSSVENAAGEMLRLGWQMGSATRRDRSGVKRRTRHEKRQALSVPGCA